MSGGLIIGSLGGLVKVPKEVVNDESKKGNVKPWEVWIIKLEEFGVMRGKGGKANPQNK